MKKLTLSIILLLGVGNLSLLYAADDLDDLDKLLEGWEEEMSDDASMQDDINEQDVAEATDETKAAEDDSIAEEIVESEEEAEVNSVEEEGGTEGAEEMEAEEENNTNANKKLALVEKEVTSDTVKLEFVPLEEYSNYKVYYAETGEENFSEREIIIDNQESSELEFVEVIIDGLKPDTEYQFIVKAFDNEGNPIEATTSDPIVVKTAEQHAAPSDNVIYDPVVKVEGEKIIISWKPGVDVHKVQISFSEDGRTFKPVATVEADKKTYTIVADKTGKKYIKLVPISEDGTLGVCKIGATEVPYITANVELKKEAEKKIGHSQTGPEIYLLLLIAFIIAIIYAYRRKLTQ